MSLFKENDWVFPYRDEVVTPVEMPPGYSRRMPSLDPEEQRLLAKRQSAGQTIYFDQPHTHPDSHEKMQDGSMVLYPLRRPYGMMLELMKRVNQSDVTAVRGFGNLLVWITIDRDEIIPSHNGISSTHRIDVRVNNQTFTSAPVCYQKSSEAPAQAIFENWREMQTDQVGSLFLPTDPNSLSKLGFRLRRLGHRG